MSAPSPDGAREWFKALFDSVERYFAHLGQYGDDLTLGINMVDNVVEIARRLVELAAKKDVKDGEQAQMLIHQLAIASVAVIYKCPTGRLLEDAPSAAPSEDHEPTELDKDTVLKVLHVADLYLETLKTAQAAGKLTPDQRLGVMVDTMMRGVDRIKKMPDDRDLNEKEKEQFHAALIQVVIGGLGMLHEVPPSTDLALVAALLDDGFYGGLPH